jgi:hypothetical protein
MYKCHNCSANQAFCTFLKNFDEGLYKEYLFEKYQGDTGFKPSRNDSFKIKMVEPVFIKKNVLSTVAVQLHTLADSHPAVLYTRQRQIPQATFPYIWFIPNTRDILSIAPEKYLSKDKATTLGTEPRLLFPLYNTVGSLTGVAMRAIKESTLRYINLKFVEDEPLIFGLERVDLLKPVVIVEGAIDSLFLDNAIAVNGVGFNKLEDLKIPDVTFVFDNQPRNREVVREVSRYVVLGFKVCIWPSNIHEKDVNEMIVSGINVSRVIAENTYQGLTAQMQVAKWRKIQ